MLRDNLAQFMEVMLNSAGAHPLALCIHPQARTLDDKLLCLQNPCPEGAEPSLTKNATSPFQTEPAQTLLLSRGIPAHTDGVETLFA